ncbi:unnamed protein product [Cylicocyclus nassatus]|uniref:Uncharacterized protein n=1 Tax=Cylicocyclus nassatus TaxID=53992 RepID=A0AA36H1V4_CYLNA|nr:unnamed protein product [Cylicocyclus nassatus]
MKKLGKILKELIGGSQHMIAFEISITESEEETIDLLRTRIKSIQHTATPTSLQPKLKGGHPKKLTWIMLDLTATAMSLLNRRKRDRTFFTPDNLTQAKKKRETTRSRRYTSIIYQVVKMDNAAAIYKLAVGNAA